MESRDALIVKHITDLYESMFKFISLEKHKFVYGLDQQPTTEGEQRVYSKTVN